jgi:S1-C subfamily serine protease
MRVFAILFALWCSVAHADLKEQEQQAVLPIYSSGKWNGTGFFVGDSFYTAYHVVDGGYNRIADSNGRWYDIDVVDYDRNADWARCRVPGYKSLHRLKWSTGMANGDGVAAYGYQGSGLKHTTGEVRYAFYDQRSSLTTAKVRGGYSGGPVVDRRTNRVLGIVTQCTGWSNQFYGNSIITRYDVIR